MRSLGGVLRRWWPVAILVAVASACGGDSGGVADEAPSSAFIVESSDGLATLSFPVGSLPPEVSPDDVSVDAIGYGTVEQGSSVLSVELQPHGVVLLSPATLTVTLPRTLGQGFMAIHLSGDLIEFLEGTVDHSNGAVAFEARIGHFSDVEFFPGGDFSEATAVAVPELVSVGDSAQATGSLTLPPDGIGSGFRLVLQFDEDADGTAREVYFSGIRNVEVEDANIGWISRAWDPFGGERVALFHTRSGLETQDATVATCVSPNTDGPLFSAYFTFEAEMIVASAPIGSTAQDGDVVFRFRQEYDPDASPTKYDEPGTASFRISEMSAGDIVKGRMYVSDYGSSICSEGSTAAADDVVAVPAGMDPRAVIVNVEPVVTANGTRGFVVTFAQELDGIPELYSYFFLLEFSNGVCSETGGVENHANVKTHLGSANTSLLDTGQVLVDTGCSLDSDPFDVVGRSGSQDTSTQQAQFLEFVAHISGSDLDGARGVVGEVACDFADADALANGCSD